MALVAFETTASLSYPFPIKLAFLKGPAVCLLPPKERGRHVHANQRAAFR